LAVRLEMALVQQYCRRAYDATLEVASTSMIYSIYGFSNYLPVVINLVMFVIFLKFDLEEKLPKMREEIAARRAGKTIEK
jgi:GPH family glycoside/pentoside/hexuronide:cation symporter